MYLIVGLGNPEEEYANTRHNMGFWTINELAKKYKIDVNRSNFKGIYGTGDIENEKVMLLKPQTYMNLSGDSINEVKKFYKLENKNIIVIFDDIELEPGSIRIRRSGGPGTHNGMRSVVDSLMTYNFTRIRVGIGKPEEGTELIDYVIRKIAKKDEAKLKEGAIKAAEAVIEILKNGIESSMNKFN